jgi:hypothetical protein
MSLLNAFPMGPDWCVTVDSMSLRDDGERQHMQKLFVLPFASGVFACRGEQSKLPPALAGQYLTDRWGNDFDGILDTFPALVQKCHDELAAHLKGWGGLDAEAQELLLVGYSPRRTRVVCLHAMRPAGVPTFTVTEKERGHVAPDPGFDPSTKQCDDVFHLCWETAAAQTQSQRAKDPSIPIGGHITVAVVRERRVIVSNIGRA